MIDGGRTIKSPFAGGIGIAALVFAVACGGSARPPALTAKNLLLITVDTLRADHVGAYGYPRARTPALDSIARGGALFERAYAAAPITLPSHATILSGRYPPGHGSRDNGQPVTPSTATLATVLRAKGFKTAAFVAAFPLDHQFGLDRGFDVYGDHLPRDAAGRPTSERPASQVIDEAIAWLRGTKSQGNTGDRFFLWVHLFEPHAPYQGDMTRPAIDRYDDEIATADREIGRLLSALGQGAAVTLVVAAGDHGEAFGEHGEFAHSIFVYDTTLRVPLLIGQPGTVTPRVVPDPVTLADIAPTVARLLGIDMTEFKTADGIDLSPALAGGALPKRELYAESFAPLMEFGWAPLRSIRSGPWKYIAAPRPELYDLERDVGEQRNLRSEQDVVAKGLEARVDRYSGDVLPTLGPAGPERGGRSGTSAMTDEAAGQLRALGYSAGSSRTPGGARPDPKDRRDLAARIAQVTSGELTGAPLIAALEGIVRDDPRNGQAHLRLGFARLQQGDCRGAESEFHAAIANALPSADAYAGLATCLGQRRDFAGAGNALSEAKRLEPDNPVITANVGILKAQRGDLPGAIDALKLALKGDPNLHEARFNLAIAYAKAGRRADAAAAARELLARLPPEAPQRTEVQRLLDAVR